MIPEIALGITILSFLFMMTEKIMKNYERLTIIETKLEHLLKHIEYLENHDPRCKP